MGATVSIYLGLKSSCDRCIATRLRIFEHGQVICHWKKEPEVIVKVEMHVSVD